MIAQTMPARRGPAGQDGVPGWSLGAAAIPGTVGALQTVNVDVPISPALANLTPALIVAEVYGAPSLLTNLRADTSSATVLNASTVRVPVTSLLALGTLTGGGVKVTIKR